MHKKHIATYPLYGTSPLNLRVDTKNRLGTGYIYTVAEIPALEARLERFGHPLQIRWRNDECWQAAILAMKELKP